MQYRGFLWFYAKPSHHSYYSCDHSCCYGTTSKSSHCWEARSHHKVWINLTGRHVRVPLRYNYGAQSISTRYRAERPRSRMQISLGKVFRDKRSGEGFFHETGLQMRFFYMMVSDYEIWLLPMLYHNSSVFPSYIVYKILSVVYSINICIRSSLILQHFAIFFLGFNEQGLSSFSKIVKSF